jgi:hypothetical protein
MKLFENINGNRFKLIRESVSPKSVALIEKWIKELGHRKAGVKIIDSVLRQKTNGAFTSGDLADSLIFSNGLDEIETLLGDGNYRAALDQAVETATEMVREEGGEGIFENQPIKEMAKPNTKPINKELTTLTTNKYFDSIPTQSIQEILDRYNLGKDVETGENVMDGIYTGAEGRMEAPISKDQRGNTNMMFIMTWYKMGSGRYEIVVYVG